MQVETSIFRLLFDPRGATNRASFIMGCVLLSMLSSGLALASSLPIFVIVVSNFVLFCLLSKRFRDIGILGRWAIVPFAVLLLCIGLLLTYGAYVLNPQGMSAMSTLFAWVEGENLSVITMSLAWSMLGLFVVSAICPRALMRRKG